MIRMRGRTLIFFMPTGDTTLTVECPFQADADELCREHVGVGIAEYILRCAVHDPDIRALVAAELAEEFDEVMAQIDAMAGRR